MWEKEKLLVTSNFFFSHNVFKNRLLLKRQNEYLCCKRFRNLLTHGRTPIPKQALLLHVCSTRLLKTVGKGEIARNQQYLFFHSVFYPFTIFFKFKLAVCKLFQFETVSNLSFGKCLN